MELKLEKPIIFFDLETTGINIAKDRIVEISILKVSPDGTEETKTWLVNPEMEIPKEASDIHGITNEKVVTEKTFNELAPEVSKIIEGCDLAGFNSNRFDIPLLAEEMLRAEVEFNMIDRVAVDVQVIFHKKEERTLSAGYKFYCDKNLDNAHSAEADTKATYEILKAQLDKYEDLENNIEFLNKFSTHNRRADFAGFIQYDEDDNEIFTFGKYKGQQVKEILKKDKGYFSWIQNADFPLYTKQVLKEIREKVFPPKTESTLADLQSKFNQKL
ncbi:DNA polymerase-3 subunit epsilon [Lutibacter oricola]|uniref:DNA polymerase-3 subunit epsilon n=1 Tax=Lutibacter oricola TaxID=762486 RepID=A0A1H3C9V7_9FLAO|nr:3'-5' exonuclease [Lutibacter oricola]SDX50876.1 DNA polymerase-3 subunit epsilon [Lutibacter oricola]